VVVHRQSVALEVHGDAKPVDAEALRPDFGEAFDASSLRVEFAVIQDVGRAVSKSAQPHLMCLPQAPHHVMPNPLP
jgi:hypothetical protein